jgi:hypothetical protein
MVRVGLLLAASIPLLELAPRLGGLLSAGAPRFGGVESGQLGLALLLAATLPGASVVWWDPPSLDPIANASLTPVSPSLQGSMEWIRQETPPTAVFLASPLYSPELAVRTGRRVLRWSNAARPADEPRRVRAERILLARRPLPDWLRAYGVDYVFAAPGDFRSRRVESPESLRSLPGLGLQYSDEWRFHIYEVLP